MSVVGGKADITATWRNVRLRPIGDIGNYHTRSLLGDIEFCRLHCYRFLGMKSVLQNALLVVASAVISFVLFEAGVKAYVGRSLEGSYWIFSNDKTVKFDPVAGFRMTADVTMEARITKGEIEYVGAWRGNNQGFQSRNFTPGRQDQRRRFAVFGDSFTHGEMLARNWPSYA